MTVAFHMTTSAQRLAYEEHGAGAPALVFLHGWSCARAVFARQVEAFAGTNRLLVIDLPGQGESDPLAGPYTIEALASRVAGLLESRGVHRAVVAGHSSGALLALQLAAEVPARVSGVVLIEPTALVLWPALRASFEALAASMERGEQELRAAVVSSMFLPTSDPELVAEITTMMNRTPAAVGLALLRGILAFDGEATARRVGVRALRISATPVDPASDPYAALTGLQTVCTTDAGHFNQLEAAEQVNAQIRTFIDSLRTAG